MNSGSKVEYCRWIDFCPEAELYGCHLEIIRLISMIFMEGQKIKRTLGRLLIRLCKYQHHHEHLQLQATMPLP